MAVINLVTPKAAAKRELLFNKPASEAGLLSQRILRRVDRNESYIETQVFVQETHLRGLATTLRLGLVYIGDICV